MVIIQATDELAAVAAALSRSTVQVRGRRSSGGSGVIWRDGLIVTNAHVVRGSRATVELSDGRVFDAEVTARDDSRDLAALKVDATDLPAVEIGDSDALRVGELVVAVGNPYGFVGALTTGIIHSLSVDISNTNFKNDRDRWIDRTNPKSKIQNPKSDLWVMADIRLAPGNSGGVLADARGRAIGINSMIAGGLGLAVPSNAVERFLKKPERPYLGVTLQPVVVPLGYKRILGLLVLEIASGSLAQSVGLLTGDVLIGVGDRSFKAPNDLLDALSHANPGDPIQLALLRGGRRIFVEAIADVPPSAVEAA